MSIPNICEPFQYGGNYAWNAFGNDVGGGNNGFAANSALICNHLNEMAQHNVDILRVWIYPDLRSPGINFDANECVTSVGGTTQADIRAFSQCAADNGIKIMWTMLAHNANDTDAEQSATRPKLRPAIVDATCRSMFMQNLVRPITSIIVNDPNYAATYHSIDLFNEPEWLIDDANPVTPSQPFNGYHINEMGVGNSVTYNQMRTFLSEMRNAVFAEDPNACVTIGTAGMKWAPAWESLVEFNSPHVYNWSEAYFPSDNPPSSYGLTKPTLIGEFPPNGLDADAGFVGQVPGALPKTQTEFLCSLAENGYTAALAWSFRDTVFNWRGQNMDDGNNFIINDVKRLRSLDVTPSTYVCGQDNQLTLRSLSNKNQHVPLDESSLTTSIGAFSDLVYNANTCTYTVTFTAPDCPSSVNASIQARDVNGNIGGGIVLFEPDGNTDCVDGDPCQFFVGECNDGPICTINVSASGACIPDEENDPYCLVNVQCNCKPTVTKILGGDPTCPKLGETFEFAIGGCNCAGFCGPAEVRVKAGSNKSDICYFTDTKVLRIGPVTDCNAIRFGVVCVKEDPCISLLEDGQCLNHSVFITDINQAFNIPVSLISPIAIKAQGVKSNTNSTVANVVSTDTSVIGYASANGTSKISLELRDIDGNYFYCDLNVFVNDPELN
jgi:hypothetical protein